MYVYAIMHMRPLLVEGTCLASIFPVLQVPSINTCVVKLAHIWGTLSCESKVCYYTCMCSLLHINLFLPVTG